MYAFNRNFDSSPFFLFLPVSYSGLFSFAFLYLRKVSTKISREVNNSTKQKVFMAGKVKCFFLSVTKGGCMSNSMESDVGQPHTAGVEVNR